MRSVIDINTEDWEKEVLSSNTLTVVDFWHEYCPWCLRLNPVLEEAAEIYEGRMKFVKLNILETPESRGLAIRYGVMSTPPLIFFCEGQPIETVVGYMSLDRLTWIIDSVIERHTECLRQSTRLEL